MECITYKSVYTHAYSHWHASIPKFISICTTSMTANEIDKSGNEASYALTRHSNTRRFAQWLGFYNFTHQSLALPLALENLSLVCLFVWLFCFFYILDSIASLFRLFVGFTSSENIVQFFVWKCVFVCECVYTYIIVLYTLNLGLKYELPKKSINYSVQLIISSSSF